MSELLKELVLKVEGLQYWNDHYKNCIQQGEQKTIHELGLYKKLSEINDRLLEMERELRGEKTVKEWDCFESKYDELTKQKQALMKELNKG